MEKWPIFEQNHGLTPLENVNISTFWTCCFYCQERRLFVLEYHKTRFPSLYCLKKISWKNDQFSSKTFGKPSEQNLWKNVNFSTISTSFFYCLEMRFFVLEYQKTHFPGRYCLKKKVGKMTNFWAKPWVNPFGKMSIFRRFELLVFIA